MLRPLKSALKKVRKPLKSAKTAKKKKYLKPLKSAKRGGELTNERPGSDHVTRGPMRGLKKDNMGRGQTDIHTDITTKINSTQIKEERKNERPH